MKVLLLFPATETPYGIPNYPPLGLSYLAGMLKKNKISYNILDLRLYPDWKKILLYELKKEYDLICISSTTFDFRFAKKISNIIKKTTNSKIAIGGAHATLRRGKLLEEEPSLDFVISGEGEYALIELCNSLNKKINLDQIKGLSFRKKDRIINNKTRELIDNLDEIPFPEYEKYDLKLYHGDTSIRGIINRSRIMPILSSRGCPFNCIYCSVPLISGKRFRPRSPKKIIEEIKLLKKEYGAKIIDFLDDNFTLDIERAKEICRLIIQEKLNMRWGVPNGIRVDRIDEELVQLMKKAGCNEIALGIESIDDTVLKNLKKNITFEKIKIAINLLNKHKIPIKGFFLVGSPGGSKEEVLKALNFSINNNLKEARFSMLTPYPETDLCKWVEKNKYWVVKNPMQKILESADTGVGYVKALYETSKFKAKEKEEIYNYVMNRWETEKRRKNLTLRLKYWLSKHKRIYNFLKKTRDKLKK